MGQESCHALLQIGEVFGHDTALGRLPGGPNEHPCPFREGKCTKGNKSDPLGICSFTNGELATVVCPVRFLDRNRMFTDAAAIAFGTSVEFAAVPEIRVLEVLRRGRKQKIGKVDFLLVRMEGEKAIDFAALEVQAVYISGHSIKPTFDHYKSTGKLGSDGKRRPDFRSSAQKRLMPQLALKVPIFRRWGKRFFVAVDSTFFAELPEMREQSPGNAEVTWLVYNFRRNVNGGYYMASPRIVHTLWDDVVLALREGTAPEKSDILSELSVSVRKVKRLST